MDWIAVAQWGDLILGSTMAILALVVFWLAPSQRINILFGWTFLLEGFYLIAEGVFLWRGETQTTVALLNSATGATFAVPILYFGFVAHAAPVQWTSWLRARYAHLVVLAGAVLAMLLVGLSTSPLSLGYASIGAKYSRNFDIWFGVLLVLYSLAIAAIAQHYRRSTPQQRRQGKLFLVAAIARDSAFLVLYPVTVVIQSTVGDGTTGLLLREVLWVPFTATFIAAMTIGVFRGQVVDIDRKMHVGLSRTFVATLFVAVAVGVQTGISEFTSESWGFLAAAGVAALLVLAFKPLYSVAERIADTALPRGQRTPNWENSSARAFYQEQLQVAYSDGSVRPKERIMLDNLRKRIGLPAEQALAIESDFLATTPHAGQSDGI